MTIIEKIERKGYRVNGSKFSGYTIYKYDEKEHMYVFDGKCLTKIELKRFYLS